MQTGYEMACKARDNSYSPYSKFPVGCSMILKDGTVITGTNVENVSLGGTICAERSAMCSLISQGLNPDDIVEIHITALTDQTIKPCGICRQFLSEFIDETVKFYLYTKDGSCETYTIKDLFPNAFYKKELNV